MPLAPPVTSPGWLGPTSCTFARPGVDQRADRSATNRAPDRPPPPERKSRIQKIGPLSLSDQFKVFLYRLTPRVLLVKKSLKKLARRFWELLHGRAQARAAETEGLRSSL